MRKLLGLFAVAGFVLSISGCAEYSDLSWRKEFGCPLPNHCCDYHHAEHHWHGVCCYESGHEWYQGCAEKWYPAYHGDHTPEWWGGRNR